MTPLLSVRDLAVRYRRDGGVVDALRGVSFDLAEGERLAVMGESGSGKSSLALALGNLLPRGTERRGGIEWQGAVQTPANGRGIGFVFQDPTGSLDPVMRAGDQIEEAARAHLPLSRAEARKLSLDLIAKVKLPQPEAIADAYPHQLSGGQKQRIAIACAIAAQPRLLVADEATSALDTVVQAGIATLIDEFVRTEGLSLIFITHDIALASQTADRIAIFRSGLLVEIGETAQIVSHPQQPYTRQLLASHIGLDARSMLPAAKPGARP
ncbi:MAG TPA: ABC transporter ATP-binding protein [Mesorhizobium sp.]